MADLRLPEAIEKALSRLPVRDASLSETLELREALRGVRRAIAAELLKRAIDSAEIVDAWWSEKGRRGQTKVKEHLERLRAQADALDKEPPHGESR